MKVLIISSLVAFTAFSSCSPYYYQMKENKQAQYYNTNRNDQYLVMKAHHRSRWQMFDDYDNSMSSYSPYNYTIALYTMSNKPFGFYNVLSGSFDPFTGTVYCYSDIYSPFGLYDGTDPYYQWNYYNNPYCSTVSSNSSSSFAKHIIVPFFKPYAGIAIAPSLYEGDGNRYYAANDYYQRPASSGFGNTPKYHTNFIPVNNTFNSGINSNVTNTQTLQQIGRVYQNSFDNTANNSSNARSASSNTNASISQGKAKP